MLCRKISSVDRSPESERVYLNVYDLAPINGCTYWFGLGMFHSGVQVRGWEYAFAGHESSATGIFEAEPKQFAGCRFRKSIMIGWTDLCDREIVTQMELSQKYRGNAYDIITNNCNHFSNDFCIKLTGNPIPKWVNRLAKIGLLCQCIVPVELRCMKIQQQKLEEKVCHEELEKKKKKKLRSNKNKLSSDSSSSPTKAATIGSRDESSFSLPPSPLITDSSEK